MSRVGLGRVSRFSPSLLFQDVLETGQELRVKKLFIMDEENPKINVVVKTSKNKETIQTESTATILEVCCY